MNKTKTRILIAVGVLAVIALLYASGLLRLNSNTHLGWYENKNTDSWTSGYLLFSGKRAATLELKGETLNIDITTKSGSLTVDIKDAGGKELLNKEFTSSEKLDLKASGEIDITVIGKGHRGGFSFSE